MGISCTSGYPLNVYRMDYKAYGLGGKVFCVDAVKREAKKHPNTRDYFNLGPQYHWIESSLNWGTVVALA